LLAAQGALAHSRIRAYDRGFDPARRVELVRSALDDDGLLLTTADFAPNVGIWLRGVKEFSLIGMLRNVCQQERRLLGEEELVQYARRMLPRILKQRAHVAVELNYR